MSTIDNTTPTVGDFTSALTQFGNNLEETLNNWDYDRNGIIDKNEAFQGFLKVVKLIALFVSIVGMLISGISTAYGIVNDDFNWIIIIVGLSLFVGVGIIFLVLKIQAQASIDGMQRVVNEHRTKMNDLMKKDQTVYGELKQRFIEYKSTAEGKIEKLYTQIDGLKEEKYQLMADAGFKSAMLTRYEKEEEKELQKNP